MFTTPILQNFPQDRGLFYTFTSAINHINLTLASDQIRVGFSKYALLNLPEVRFQSTENRRNRIYPELLLGRRDAPSNIASFLETNRTKETVSSLQNFAFEFENRILNSGNYNANILNTSIAERIFWKWLIETGAIRFKHATNETTIKGDTPEDLRWTEEEFSSLVDMSYDPVVTQLGNISIMGNKQDGNMTTGEIFLQIPGNEGNTPDVLFKSVRDSNYRPNISLAASDFILGNDTEFSSETGNPTVPFFNDSSGGTNVFSTAPVADWTETEDMNLIIPAQDLGYTWDVFKSKVDGVSLDFDPASYTSIKESNFVNFSDLNSSDLSSNFKFNAALLYYDVYVNEGGEWRSVSTNLYGVQFLTPQTASGSGSATQLRWPHLQKFKNVVDNDKVNGNSYGFRLNTYIDNSSKQIEEVSPVNDYNSRSLELYTNVANLLVESTKRIQKIITTQHDQVERIEKLEDIILGDGTLTLEMLEDRIMSLERRFGIATPLWEVHEPQDVWVIEHNLGIFPNVTVTDKSKNVIYPAIKYIDNHKVEITFSRPTSGFVFLNTIQVPEFKLSDKEVEELTEIKTKLDQIEDILNSFIS